jgi:CyaY protein
MTDADYNALCDALFARLDEVLEAHPAGLDFENNGALAEVAFDDGGKIIINRQPPAREVWIAAKTGGYHFRHQNGLWRDTRDGEEFFARLRQCLSAHGADE